MLCNTTFSGSRDKNIKISINKNIKAKPVVVFARKADIMINKSPNILVLGSRRCISELYG
jgi:hypothetical protein